MCQGNEWKQRGLMFCNKLNRNAIELNLKQILVNIVVNSNMSNQSSRMKCNWKLISIIIFGIIWIGYIAILINHCIQTNQINLIETLKSIWVNQFFTVNVFSCKNLNTFFSRLK